MGAGLRNVAVAESRISSIDGTRGVLAYRGIDIHALAEHSSFEETAYLLHHGELPTRAELEAFSAELAGERAVPDLAREILRALPGGTHPMTAMRTVVSALGASDPAADDDGAPARGRKALRLIAQMATVVALIERQRTGALPVAPDPSLSHAANFLYMLNGQRPTAGTARAMDQALVLHADHEFNASTFAARVAASTLADVHGAVVAAIATLKGPLHGGANEAVMRMLEGIGSVDRVEAFLRETFAQKKKIMGFGHAVYRTEDPRATHLRRMSERLGAESGQPAFYLMSRRIEEIVGGEKRLYPNVDFYSASAYHVMGIKTDLFTPVFAVSRIAGWTAHVQEQLADNKLIRPVSEYVGAKDVRYVPLAERG
ncbi:MAG TPA: citrate/2-methylcitrate synthase [Vicinamibacteria bacterium]